MAKLTDDPRVMALLQRELKKALTTQKKALLAATKQALERLVDDLCIAGNPGGAKIVKGHGRDLINNLKAYEMENT